VIDADSRIEDERVLFVTLSNIGDAVMTTPVLALLEAAYPTARIDIVAREKTAPLFAGHPKLGELIVKPRTHTLAERLAYVRRLRGRRYLAVVDLRSPFVPWLVRARRRHGKRRRDRADRHAVLDHVAVFARHLAPDAIPETRLWIPATARADVARRLPPGGTAIGIGPGAQNPHKIWPADRYAALVARLAEIVDDPVAVLLGDARDAERAADLARAAAIPTIDLAGRTDLPLTAAWLERCAAFVGNDSGLGHMASAVGTPTLTLFGPGQPARYRPWGARARWLVADDEDLERLSVQAVADALGELVVGSTPRAGQSAAGR